jgi:hypothetical protein
MLVMNGLLPKQGIEMEAMASVANTKKEDPKREQLLRKCFMLHPTSLWKAKGIPESGYPVSPAGISQK